MRKSLIAMAAALPMWLGLSTAAKADVDFQLYFGVPYYEDQIGPDYRFYEGRGWYRDRVRNRLTCREARRLVRNSGYRNVATRECNGRTYTFSATRRGRDVVVYVNSRTRALWRG